MLAWFKLLKLSVKIKFQIQRDYSYMKMRLLISRTILLLLLHVVSGEDKSDRDTLELVLPLSCREVIFQSATDPISCTMVSCRIF